MTVLSALRNRFVAAFLMWVQPAVAVGVVGEAHPVALDRGHEGGVSE
jgi:hypothetical protein